MARLVTRDNTEQEKERIGYGYAKMDHETIVAAFEKTDEIIRGIAESKSVALIDASKEMTGYEAFFSDHVHLSEEGSARLARLVAERMIDLTQG